MQNRRDLAMFLAAAAVASGQTKKSTALASKTWRFENLPVKRNAQNAGRAVLEGATHTGFNIEMHETELAPGAAPHAAHKHLHEELVLVREGTIEVTIEGVASKIGPGGVAFVASNEMHGWRNAGETVAHYFVVTLGRAPSA